MQFTATIKRGTHTLSIHNRAEMGKFIASLAHSDKDVPVVLTVEKRKKKRSDGVNRYWWGVVIVVIQRGMNELGNDFTKEQTHEFLKANFAFNEVVNEDTGEIYRIPRSTADMNGEDFWELIEKVTRFAAEYLNEVIPPPGEQAKMDFNS